MRLISKISRAYWSIKALMSGLMTSIKERQIMRQILKSRSKGSQSLFLAPNEVWLENRLVSLMSASQERHLCNGRTIQHFKNNGSRGKYKWSYSETWEKTTRTKSNTLFATRTSETSAINASQIRGLSMVLRKSNWLTRIINWTSSSSIRGQNGLARSTK